MNAAPAYSTGCFSPLRMPAKTLADTRRRPGTDGDGKPSTGAWRGTREYIALVSGKPHLPQMVGGVEVNTHELAGELIRRGHRASVVAKLSLRNVFGVCRAARTAVNGRGVWNDS